MPTAWDRGLGGGFREEEHEQAGCGVSELTVRPRGVRRPGCQLAGEKIVLFHRWEMKSPSSALSTAQRAVALEQSALGSVRSPGGQCCSPLGRSRSLPSGGPSRRSLAACLPPGPGCRPGAFPAAPFLALSPAAAAFTPLPHSRSDALTPRRCGLAPFPLPTELAGGTGLWPLPRPGHCTEQTGARHSVPRSPGKVTAGHGVGQSWRRGLHGGQDGVPAVWDQRVCARPREPLG